jgi:hypothetical protein
VSDSTLDFLDPEELPADRVEALANWLQERNIGICEMDDDLVYNDFPAMRDLATALLQHGPEGIRIERQPAVRTEEDEQHRELAQGAVELAARAMAAGASLNDILVADVVEEGVLAWLSTGLLTIEARLSERDSKEIVTAIVGRTATVLVMVGWQPPARLLADPPSSVPSGAVNP